MSWGKTQNAMMDCSNNEIEFMSEQLTEDIYDLERKLQQVLRLQDHEDDVRS